MALDAIHNWLHVSDLEIYNSRIAPPLTKDVVGFLVKYGADLAAFFDEGLPNVLKGDIDSYIAYQNQFIKYKSPLQGYVNLYALIHTGLQMGALADDFQVGNYNYEPQYADAVDVADFTNMEYLKLCQGDDIAGFNLFGWYSNQHENERSAKMVEHFFKDAISDDQIIDRDFVQEHFRSLLFYALACYDGVIGSNPEFGQNLLGHALCYFMSNSKGEINYDDVAPMMAAYNNGLLKLKKLSLKGYSFPYVILNYFRGYFSRIDSEKLPLDLREHVKQQAEYNNLRLSDFYLRHDGLKEDVYKWALTNLIKYVYETNYVHAMGEAGFALLKYAHFEKPDHAMDYIDVVVSGFNHLVGAGISEIEGSKRLPLALLSVAYQSDGLKDRYALYMVNCLIDLQCLKYAETVAKDLRNNGYSPAFHALKRIRKIKKQNAAAARKQAREKAKASASAVRGALESQSDDQVNASSSSDEEEILDDAIDEGLIQIDIMADGDVSEDEVIKGDDDESVAGPSSVESDVQAEIDEAMASARSFCAGDKKAKQSKHNYVKAQIDMSADANESIDQVTVQSWGGVLRSVSDSTYSFVEAVFGKGGQKIVKFTIEDARKAMKELGFENVSDSGNLYAEFTLQDGSASYSVNMHQPHGSKENHLHYGLTDYLKKFLERVFLMEAYNQIEGNYH